MGYLVYRMVRIAKIPLIRGKKKKKKCLKNQKKPDVNNNCFAKGLHSLEAKFSYYLPLGQILVLFSVLIKS